MRHRRKRKQRKAATGWAKEGSGCNQQLWSDRRSGVGQVVTLVGRLSRMAVVMRHAVGKGSRDSFYLGDFLHVVEVLAMAGAAAQVEQGRDVAVANVGGILSQDDSPVDQVGGNRNHFTAVLAGYSQVLLGSRLTAHRCSPQ